METNLGHFNTCILVSFIFLQLYERSSCDCRSIFYLSNTKQNLQDKYPSLLFIATLIPRDFNSLLSYNEKQDH